MFDLYNTLESYNIIGGELEPSYEGSVDGLKKVGKENEKINSKDSNTAIEKRHDYISLNIDILKKQIKYNYRPYPKGYFKDVDALLKQIKKDLLKLVIALTATKEFNNEASRVLIPYNVDLKKLTEEELWKKYRFGADSDFKPLSINELKRRYTDIAVRNEDGSIYASIGDNSLGKAQQKCLGIYTYLPKFIAPKYVNYCKFKYLSNDENGCIIISNIPTELFDYDE